MDETLEIFKTIQAEEDCVVQIKEATQRDGLPVKSYSLGYDVFDDALRGGVSGGNLVIITGLSGHGKTSYAMNLCVNLSDRLCSSLFFSYEVNIDDLYSKFKEMNIDEESLKIYSPKKNTSGSTEWLEKKIKEGIEKFNTKFIFIDHIDYIFPKKISNADAYRHVVGQTVRELKTLAIELDVVIFLMAHVRKVGIGKNIEMQDLQESGDLYKQADLIFAVARNIEVQKVGGVRTEFFGEFSNIRILKNRKTGQQAMLEFKMVNNRITLIDNPVVVKDFYKENPEIIISDKLFD